VNSCRFLRTWWPWVLAAQLLAGCASTPSLPGGLDLARASFEPLNEVVQVRLEEAGLKSPTAQAGGWLGLGAGLGVGGLACAATGPLALLCYASVVPLATAVGGVGGMAVGKAVAGNAEGVAEKTQLLQREWALLNERSPLGQAVGRLLPARGALHDESLLPAAAGPASSWRLELGYATLGTLGSGTGEPFALQGTARLKVSRAGQKSPEFEKLYTAQGTSRLTLESWAADEAKALRRVLDEVAAALADQIATDLARGAKAAP